MADGDAFLMSLGLAYYVALAGAAIVVALPIIDSHDVFYSRETGIDWDVIFLLLGMMIIVGVLLLALIIWFAGPYFAFADHRPLESVAGRLVAIVVLLLVFVTVLLIKQMRSARASSQLAAEVTRQDDAGAAGSGTDAAQLRKRFEEARPIGPPRSVSADEFIGDAG